MKWIWPDAFRLNAALRDDFEKYIDALERGGLEDTATAVRRADFYSAMRATACIDIAQSIRRELRRDATELEARARAKARA